MRNIRRHRCYYCKQLDYETLTCVTEKGEIWVDFKDQFHITDANKLKRVFGNQCQSFERREGQQ